MDHYLTFVNMRDTRKSTSNKEKIQKFINYDSLN